MGRQLTITLFYLVLIVLLCRQVHVKFTPAYSLFDSTLQRAARQERNDNRLTADALLKQTHERFIGERVLPYYNRVIQIQMHAAELFYYLQNQKQRIADGAVEKSNFFSYRHDRQLVRDIFIRQGEWKNIYQKLDSFSAYVWTSLARTYYVSEDDKIKKWFSVRQDALFGAKLFGNLSPAGAVAVLSALQNDIALCESRLIDQLRRESMGCNFGSCDGITAIAVPSVSYVAPGEQVQATIFLAAYNKSSDVIISSPEGKMHVADGIGHWRGKASGLGRHVVSGNATDRLGDSMVTRPWSFEYFVGTGTFVSLSFDKMNTCYHGIPCSVTMAADGYAPENISLHIPGAVVNKILPGHFEIIAPDKPVHTLAARADVKDAAGNVFPVGGMILKVKDAPPPLVMISGCNEGVITVAALRNSSGLAVIPPLDDMDYKIISWQMTVIHKGSIGDEIPVSVYGNALPEKSIAGVKPGDRLLLSDIVIHDQYGHTYSLPMLSVRVE